MGLKDSSMGTKFPSQRETSGVVTAMRTGQNACAHWENEGLLALQLCARSSTERRTSACRPAALQQDGKTVSKGVREGCFRTQGIPATCSIAQDGLSFAPRFGPPDSDHENGTERAELQPQSGSSPPASPLVSVSGISEGTIRVRRLERHLTNIGVR